MAELGYTGQISFDFLVTDDGLSYVECNPRATDGALLPRAEIAGGLLEPDADTSHASRARRPSSTSR